jgi:hypothetical protein
MSTLDLRRNDADVSMARAKRELIATKRAIALGKLAEFQRQCERLAKLVVGRVIGRAEAADGLFEAAVANDLIEVHGLDCIQRCMATAFEMVALDRASNGRAA